MTAATAVKKTPINRLNDLVAKEWIPETVSVWVQRGLGKGHEHAQIEKLHPAPFSYQDVARLIWFFTKAGETVLDPFLGVGSTLKAAAFEQRTGIGIELNKKYADLAEKRLATEVDGAILHSNPQRVVHGDARMVLRTLPKQSIKFVVTSSAVLEHPSQKRSQGEAGTAVAWTRYPIQRRSRRPWQCGRIQRFRSATRGRTFPNAQLFGRRWSPLPCGWRLPPQV